MQARFAEPKHLDKMFQLPSQRSQTFEGVARDHSPLERAAWEGGDRKRGVNGHLAFGDMGDSGWYALGILLVIAGSISGGLGMNLIKRSARLETHLPTHKRKCLIIGLFLSTVFNTCLDLVSFALTPLSVIAPLGGVAIVAAAVFAALGVSGEQEPLSRPKAIGTSLVVVGISLSASFGPRPPTVVLNVDDVFRYYASPSFEFYQLITIGALALVFTGMTVDALPEFSLSRTFAVATAGGLASGLCQALIKLFATCAAAATLEGATPWRRSLFPFALLELAAVGIMLFMLLKCCVENSELTLSSSLYTVCVMVFTVTAGSAFYKEFDMHTTGTSILGFSLGIVTIIAGMATLVLFQPNRPRKVAQTEEEAAKTAKGDTRVVEATEVVETPEDGEGTKRGQPPDEIIE
jgi:hypothetical protein